MALMLKLSQIICSLITKCECFKYEKDHNREFTAHKLFGRINNSGWQIAMIANKSICVKNKCSMSSADFWINKDNIYKYEYS